MNENIVFIIHGFFPLRKSLKISSPFSYLQVQCRGEPCVRPRTNNAFVPMYDGRTQGSPLHRAGKYENGNFFQRFPY
jgi:hypothetical protein